MIMGQVRLNSIVTSLILTALIVLLKSHGKKPMSVTLMIIPNS